MRELSGVNAVVLSSEPMQKMRMMMAEDTKRETFDTCCTVCQLGGTPACMAECINTYIRP
jgi:hypothetical protein